MRTPKVWIIKEQVRRGETGPEVMDYSPAARFGEIEFITTHDVPLYPKSSVAAQWATQVKKFLREYEPEDFIVLTGQPMAIFLVGWLMGHRNNEPRFLAWRREDNAYQPVQLADSILGAA